MNKVKGLVINAKSSFFKCLLNDKREVTCRASKKLLLNKNEIITGDMVIIDLEKKYIIEQLPRNNELVRPKVSNIDEAVLVFSATQPRLSYKLLDKLIILMEINKIKTNIIITKMDLINKKEQEEIKKNLEYYQNIGYNVFYKNENMKEIINKLKNKKYLFTGQSGVGKSTLINNLIPDLEIKTQEISKALNRGKHTTRELTFYEFQNGFIVDTPGFSALNLNFSKEEIRDSYVDFFPYNQNCFFKTCMHINEPNCGVKEEINNNFNLKKRYDNYVNILKEQYDN